MEDMSSKRCRRKVHIQPQMIYRWAVLVEFPHPGSRFMMNLLDKSSILRSDTRSSDRHSGVICCLQS